MIDKGKLEKMRLNVSRCANSDVGPRIINPDQRSFLGNAFLKKAKPLQTKVLTLKINKQFEF